MSLLFEKRMAHLLETHKALDLQIIEMEKNYAPDHEVEFLKKKKLKLKDQINELKGGGND